MMRLQPVSYTHLDVYKRQVLEEPLIPVTISDDGTVRKADLASEWYDYETKQWANAAILEDESKNYEPKEIIP